MLWFLLALLLAVPVLLGLVPGTDAIAARRLLLRCCIAGAAVGLLASVYLVVAYPHMSRGASVALPVLQGAFAGAGVGLLGLVVRRFLAGRRT